MIEIPLQYPDLKDGFDFTSRLFLFVNIKIFL